MRVDTTVVETDIHYPTNRHLTGGRRSGAELVAALVDCHEPPWAVTVNDSAGPRHDRRFSDAWEGPV
jgi:hypothetical protein